MKIPNYFTNKMQNGQIVLILVLMTIVGVTIGLSLISRTVQDVRISSQIEQSSRAFSAAEAGVENALKYSSAGNFTGNVTVGGTSSNYQYNVQKIGGGPSGSTLVTFGLTDMNQTRTIWLADHTPGGDLDESVSYPLGQPIYICWKDGSGDIPAVIVTLYYKDVGNYYVIKQAYDPNNARGNSFKFAQAAGGSCGGGYDYKVTVTPSTSAGSDFEVTNTSIPLFLRIQILYSSSILAAQSSGSNSFPTQGTQITSVGQTSSGVIRRIQVIQGFKTLPSLLDFALFSP